MIPPPLSRVYICIYICNVKFMYLSIYISIYLYIYVCIFSIQHTYVHKHIRQTIRQRTCISKAFQWKRKAQSPHPVASERQLRCKEERDQTLECLSRHPSSMSRIVIAAFESYMRCSAPRCISFVSDGCQGLGSLCYRRVTEARGLCHWVSAWLSRCTDETQIRREAHKIWRVRCWHPQGHR